MRLMRAWGIVLLLSASNLRATEVSYMVEGMAEDIAVYMSAGRECKLPMHTKLDDIGGFFHQLDADAYMRGTIKGMLVLNGLKASMKRSALCAVAKRGRPKIERDFDDIFSSLKRMKP